MFVHESSRKMKIFGPLYDRVIQWSKHRHAERYLAALSFSESSFFPIPVDVMLAPMCLANLGKAWRFALIATVFSVIGGVAGYFIGYGAFESIRPWLEESSYWSAYETSRDWFDQYGIWVIFVAGFSPIPYKVFTIAAGAASAEGPLTTKQPLSYSFSTYPALEVVESPCQTRAQRCPPLEDP